MPVFAPWSEEKKKYLLIVTPPLAPESTGDEDADIRRITTKLALVIENQIRSIPVNGFGYINAGKQGRRASHRFIKIHAVCG